jgi:dihydrofolate reductase
MAKLAYIANVSLDSFIEDEHGSIDWTVPDDEVFTFITDLVRSAGTYLYGRRMYETMAPWETDPGLARQSHRVLDGRVPEVPAGRELGGRVLGVVDQEVDATGQVHGRRVVLAEAVGALADHDRAVVREVGNRRRAVGDAEAEGATALVGDVRRRHVETLEAVLPCLQGDEAPLPAELSGRDREVRRRDGPLEHLLGVTLGGHGDRHLTVGPVAGAEEGEAVRVVPVKVAEQDRPPERPAIQVP